MKKLALFSLLILCCFAKLHAQGYGTFGSAVYITTNGTIKNFLETRYVSAPKGYPKTEKITHSIISHFFTIKVL
jgi:hypothetical protein